MIDEELRHKKNMLLVDELPKALDGLKDMFLESLTKGTKELITFIFAGVQGLVCNRFGLENSDLDNFIQPVDFKVEEEKNKFALLTFEIDKDFVKMSCDSKFITIYLDLKNMDIKVYSLEYEPMSFFGKGHECYMLCEHALDGNHINYGTTNDDTYETYIDKLRSVC